MAPQIADSLRIFSFKNANKKFLLIIINNIVSTTKDFHKLWLHESQAKVRIEWRLAIFRPTSGIVEKAGK